MPRTKTILMLACAYLAWCPAPKAQNADGNNYPWQPKDVIPYRDTMAVYHVLDCDNADCQSQGVVVVGRSGAPLGPEVQFPGFPVGIALQQHTLLVFYQFQEKEETREVRVKTYDLDNHMQAGEEKTVFAKTTPFTIDYYVERDKAGNFLGLLARTTGVKARKNVGGFYEKNEAFSTGLALVTLDDKLAPHTVTVGGDRSASRYVYSGMNTRGELYLLSNTGDQMTAEKVTPSGTVAATLSQPWDMKSSDGFSMPWLFDIERSAGHVSDDGDQVSFDILYADRHRDDYGSTFQFDFAVGKGHVTTIAHDRKYFEAMSALNNGKKLRAATYDPVSVSIVEDGNYVVACREYQSSDGPNRFFYEDAIVDVFDRQFNPVKTFVIHKHLLMTVKVTTAIALHFVGNKLLAILSDGEWNKDRKTILLTLDPRSGIVSSKELHSPENLATCIIQPEYTVWGPVSPTMAFTDLRPGFFKAKPRTTFVAAEF